jgi:lipopolysaccharide biosynthesis glycosyltransferase
MTDYETGAINVALTFDANFWAPAFATMRSVCLHTKRRKDLVFHLCHRPLHQDQIDDLREIESEFGATLHFYDITQSEEFKRVIAPLPFNKRLTNIVYARLLFDHLLPQDVERLIYLDCDMMVVAPIEDLWVMQLNGHPIGAVTDPWGPFISAGRDFRLNKDLCDPADIYFNAGMLLIDMEKWRQVNITAKIKTFTAEGVMDRIYYDQGFLNIIFRDDFLPIDRKWNLIGPHKAHEALDACILHYVGKSKPWNLVSNVAFFRMYRHVMTNRIFYKFFRHRMRRRLNSFVPFSRPRGKASRPSKVAGT